MTKHGMTGKRKAEIHIRSESRLKSGAVKTAQDSGKTLSQWLIDLISANSKY
jgi:hypothetical protein